MDDTRGTLMLNRSVGEEIVIGHGADAVIVSVSQAAYGKVKLCIKAPRHIQVDRMEVYEAKEGGRP